MNLFRILRRDPAPVTHIGRTWLGHELERINAPIDLPDGYIRIGDYVAQLEAEPGGSELVRNARERLANIDALVEYPAGRFGAITRKWWQKVAG